jgi:O-acetyl-ADP-ribose deacetylase (regulator of RNase III)
MPYQIEVVQGDLTKTDTDVIVNAANNELWMGAGVAGAIKAHGGKSVEEDAMAKGPIMPGEAVFSTAGKLPFKYVIHAAVMGQDLKTSDKLIRQSTIASLVTAEKLQMKSIALPAFGTGVGGFPMQACANIMTRAVIGFEGSARTLERVQFCMLGAAGYQAFDKALKENR